MTIEKQVPFEGTLTPCPGCQGQPRFYDGGGKYRSECSLCRLRMHAVDSLTEAVYVWEHLPRAFNRQEQDHGT